MKKCTQCQQIADYKLDNGELICESCLNQAETYVRAVPLDPYCQLCGRTGDQDRPHGAYCHECGHGRKRPGRKEYWHDGEYRQYS